MLRKSKSTVARLLATENITVVEGSYRTASFNVMTRVLRIPTFKDFGKDTEDLLIGHEVGHALYTPADGWHDAQDILEGIPRAFLNIVEDIRIERLIQQKYPGLVACFKRGYKVLFDNNFFGTDGKEFSAFGLPDRINIKAKLQNLADVDFDDKESDVVKQCFSVQTWEDTVDAARALYNFVKENREEERKDDEDPKGDVEDRDTLFVDDGDGEDEVSGNCSEDESETQVSDEELESGSGEYQSVPEEPTIETDEAFRDNAGDLVDSGMGDEPYINIRPVSASDVKKLVVPYAEVMRMRNSKYISCVAATRDDFKAFECNIVEFKEFLTETKKTVNVMAREFESRKAANRYSRSRISKTGALDLNKLHSYKYNEDIFASTMTMADGKNHGMLMFVDYSSSMRDTLGNVLKQVINLCLFCRKVNIPFKVHGFTTNPHYLHKDLDTNLSLSDLSLFELLTNEMSNIEMNMAIEQLWYQTKYKITSSRGFYTLSDAERLGSTPIEATLLVGDVIATQFKQKNNIEKLSVILLTDGQSSGFDIKPDYDNGETYVNWERSGINYKMNGKRFKYDSSRTADGRADYSNRNDVTCSMIETFKKAHGCSMIGYFIIEKGWLARYTFDRVADAGIVDYSDLQKTSTLFSRQGYFPVDNFDGYDRVFLLKGGKCLDTSNEEFDVLSGAKKGELTRKFKKFAGSKKANRILATKFIEMIA